MSKLLTILAIVALTLGSLASASNMAMAGGSDQGCSSPPCKR